MPSLVEIEIRLEAIGHALSDNSLAVPVYQRSYAWEESHVLDYIRDVSDAMADRGLESEYFLGSVVVTRRPERALEVVDGQQRLATTTILLAAIRDYFAANREPERASDIESHYLFTRDLRTQVKTPRLRLNDTDREFFSRLVLSRPDSAERRTTPTMESHRRIALAARVAAAHFRRVCEASSTPADRLVDWVEYLANSVRVIWITVPTDANAFTIFETLNDRGLDLAISDLLKNYLFYRAEDRITEVQQSWIRMHAAIEAVGNEALVVDYVRHLWSARNGYTREKELYEAIKRQVTSKQAAIDLSAELLECSKLYAALLDPQHELWSSYATRERQQVQVLHQLRVVQHRPLLLAVLRSFPREEVAKVLHLAVNWTVRFLITGGLGSGTLESHYSSRAKDVLEGTIADARSLVMAMRSVVPTDNDFEVSFSTARVSKDYLARYYLRVLELQKTHPDAPELIPNPDEQAVNLEHVLPRTPSGAWHGFDADTIASHANRIGNLALLGAEANSLIGNDGFDAKKGVYARSSFALTEGIARLPTWTPETIETRQADLAALAVAAWPLGL